MDCILRKLELLSGARYMQLNMTSRFLTSIAPRQRKVKISCDLPVQWCMRLIACILSPFTMHPASFLELALL